MPTTTPLQQLFVLNSPFMQQQAAALVAAAEGRGARRRRGPRPPGLSPALRPARRREAQVRLALAFLGATDRRRRRGEQYAQVLLGSNEFLFVD